MRVTNLLSSAVKCLQLEGPDPDQGLCPWTPLGAPPPDPHILSRSRARHILSVLVLFLTGNEPWWRPRCPKGNGQFLGWIPVMRSFVKILDNFFCLCSLLVRDVESGAYIWLHKNYCIYELPWNSPLTWPVSYTHLTLPTIYSV